jgi:maltose alpha-D-glucosyltransferase/alpha-amylase
MANQQSVARGAGEVIGSSGLILEKLAQKTKVALPSRILAVEQSNSSVIYDGKFFLKLYRKLEEGLNPDSELTRYLSEKQDFVYVPPFAGMLEYRRRGKDTRVLGLMLGLVPNEGDAWKYTLDSLGRYFERVLGQKPSAEGLPAPSLLDAPDAPESQVLLDLIGGIYPERARQLGERTAGMHIALAGETDDPAFAPEAFSTLYQRSVYQSMRGLAKRTLSMLRKQLHTIPEANREAAEELLGWEGEIFKRQERLLRRKVITTKIRIHGDYHLGQVLNTGKDFVIIDFEGEPSRSLTERKLKRSPLRDVAGMLRSFHYAAHTALSRLSLRPEDVPFLEPWAEHWARFVSRVYLHAYLGMTQSQAFIPDDGEDLATLLDAFILDKAVYEVGYELNNRPAWVGIPIRGIRGILERQ